MKIRYSAGSFEWLARLTGTSEEAAIAAVVTQALHPKAENRRTVEIMNKGDHYEPKNKAEL